MADELAGLGVGPGDKVGVRLPSGTTDLYIAIMAVLLAGGAYVPVDADDPDERARLVFGEADAVAVIGADLAVERTAYGATARARGPDSPDDDAWVIFTSGSTGTPKGVAVTHRNAAAFVDAESRLFLQAAPIAPGDRVMAGLSVAFDASCEEMWLAWRYGACLVPAPRALVRSGMDVGPWLAANEITVVSTVPTLVALWPRGLAGPGAAADPRRRGRAPRSWSAGWCATDARSGTPTGPTEATVVACGAQLTLDGPVRIGLPLDGWDLAVVDEAGNPVPEGSPGELIIGGVGLARYLDPEKDAEKYAPMPSLGWDRAYRSGDVVVHDPEGLLFAGRADDQIKIGGRRIELGRDRQRPARPGRGGRGRRCRTPYRRRQPAARRLRHRRRPLRRRRRAGLVARPACPRRWCPGWRRSTRSRPGPPARSTGTPCPWPLPGAGSPSEAAGLEGTAAWLAGLWLEVLGATVRSRTDDFFDLGGGSLTAAQMVSLLRAKFPEVAVGDIYDHPTVGGLADYVDALASGGDNVTERAVPPTPIKTQVGQFVAITLLRALAAPRWLVWLLAATNVTAAVFDAGWLPTVPWWTVVVAWLVFGNAPGRMLLAAGGARLLLRGVRPGDHPRGGKVHLRLWAAERLVDQLGATGLAGCAVDDLVRPAARLPRRAAYGPALDPAGHRLPAARLRAARSNRRSTSAATGSTATCSGSARCGSGGGPGSAPAACCARAARSATTRRSRRGRPSSGPCPRASSGRARRRPGSAARRGDPWSKRPASSRAWVAGYGVTAAVLALLPAVAITAGGAAGPGRCRRREPHRRGRPDRCPPPVAGAGDRGGPAAAGADGPRRRPAGPGRDGSPARTRSAAGSPSRSGRPPGSWTTPAPGCSRCTPRC